MTIIPKSSLTFRIADSPENVRALLAQNTADHIMTGPPPITLFRGRIEGDRIQLYNALPRPKPRVAPIRIELTQHDGITKLNAHLGPSKQTRLIAWLPVVMLMIGFLDHIESTILGVWPDPAGIAVYLWLLAFIWAVWGTLVELRRYREELNREHKETKTKIEQLFNQPAETPPKHDRYMRSI